MTKLEAELVDAFEKARASGLTWAEVAAALRSVDLGCDMARILETAIRIEREELLSDLEDAVQKAGEVTYEEKQVILADTDDLDDGVAILEGVEARRRAKRGEPMALIKKVIAERPQVCVIWPYATNDGKGRTGGIRGRIKINGKAVIVTRHICEQVHGPAPSPKHVASHDPVKCNNPLCISPDCIRWATKAEDAADQRIACTKTEAAERKLSKEDAVLIFYDDRSTYKALGYRFAIAASTVGRIKRGVHLYSPVLYQDDLFEAIAAAFAPGELITQEAAESRGVFGKKKPVALSAFAGHLVSNRWRLEPAGAGFILSDLSADD